MTDEQKLREAYLGARRQTECVLDVASRLVPERYAGMHPNLTLLYDVVESMRHYFEADDEQYGDLLREP